MYIMMRNGRRGEASCPEDRALSPLSTNSVPHFSLCGQMNLAELTDEGRIRVSKFDTGQMKLLSISQ